MRGMDHRIGLDSHFDIMVATDLPVEGGGQTEIQITEFNNRGEKVSQILIPITGIEINNLARALHESRFAVEGNSYGKE